MTVHYQLPTAADFAALAGDHFPAVSVYVSTSPVVAERERAEVAVHSAFDQAIERLKTLGADAEDLDAVRAERDRIVADQQLWGGLSRSLALFVSPGFSEVFVLPNRLDDAWHAGSHFTLGQLLRAPSQDQEAFALTVSANGWSLWHATPTDRAAKLDIDQTGTANLDEATNREPGEDRPRGNFGAASQGGASRLIGDEGKKTLLDLYAKRIADLVRRELLRIDVDERIPLFVFATEPLLSLLMERAKNARRVIPVAGNPDRYGPAEIDVEIRAQLARLNISEADVALRALVDGSAGRLERDLAAIAREAADGAVERYWFDFTSSVNGRLDRESGAIEFAAGNGSETLMPNGERAGDLLPQIALLVAQRGGRIVTVRSDDLDPAVWAGPAMAELRFALA
ncbi:hypothetical protein [Agromyces archimandritae]|uniref:Uncharacterized protein n=1 Tax=Agromyces archimandritae TaxID=2781962 RepID=A0A975IPW0_9MICO|nr:hypothetical protein [Agromyces archimandritae]QTX05704.1 hypothetical protein G127AT_05720 [Agromyces archimandritae]